MSTLKTVRKMYNRYLEIEGVVFTMYAGRLNLTLQVVDQVKKFFGDKGCEACRAMAKELLSNNR